MEERRFDDLTRLLGKATSRRQVLKGLLGTAVGGMLASVGVRPPKLVGAAGTCNPAQLTQCKQQAEQLTIDCNLNCRKGGRFKVISRLGVFSCLAGCLWAQRLEDQDCDRRFGCSEGHDCCGDHCVNTDRDEQNCGSCGNVCPPNTICRGGHCHCPPPRVQCANGQCADTTCPAGREFNASACECVCAPKTCPAGQTVDPDTCQCVTLCVNQANGVQCGSSDQMCCDQQCVTTSSDSANCGTCGHACRADQLCQDSTCVCPAGTSECNGKCVDTDNDRNNCGQCSNQCPGEQQCCDGTCKDDCNCDHDQVRCNGTCCPPNQICANNQCQPPGGCDPACGPDEICCSAGVGLEGDSTSGCVSVNDYKVCPVVPLSGNGTRGDWVCCPVDQDCCGGTGYFYNLCGGATIGDKVVCCAAPTSECGAECCQPAIDTCLQALDYTGHPGGDADLGLRCCPAGSGGVLWDGTCCGADQEAALIETESGVITGDHCVNRDS